MNAEAMPWFFRQKARELLFISLCETGGQGWTPKKSCAKKAV
jgi:hypothetical protein